MSEFDQDPSEPLPQPVEKPDPNDPRVQRAMRDLLGKMAEEPEAAEPQDDLEPPEPHFLIRENAYGPGSHSIKFVDGTPVGQWLAHTHPRWRAERVLAELLERGLPAEHAEAFARRRAGRDRDTETLAALLGPDTMWDEFVRMEGERGKRLEPIRKAFLDAQKKK